MTFTFLLKIYLNLDSIHKENISKFNTKWNQLEKKYEKSYKEKIFKSLIN